MIPTEPEEITTEWLGGALGEKFPGVGVDRVDVVDWNAGTTGRARLRVEYGSSAGAPPSIFVKLPPADEMQRLMVQSTGMGRREVLFYTHLAGEVPVRCPEPYYAAANDDGSRYLMLLEDLAEKGCGFPTVFKGGTVDYARALMKSLARLHGRYWNSPRFEADLGWVDKPLRHEIGPLLIKRALDDFGEQMPGAFRDMARLYIERTDVVCDLWEEGEETLCHGDCHIGNHFEEEGKPGLLDWAMLYRCPGVRDVSYFLSNSIPSDLRRAKERALLRLYLDELSERVADPPSFEQLWRRHRRHVAYSWVAATTTLAMGDKWQAVRHGREATNRVNDAIATLSTVEVLKEDLA